MRLLLAAILLTSAGVSAGAGLGRTFLSAWGPAPHARPATPLGAELVGLRLERLRRLERELKGAKAPEQEREANRRAWEDYWSACAAACARTSYSVWIRSRGTLSVSPSSEYASR
jgi:hypothetical protein